MVIFNRRGGWWMTGLLAALLSPCAGCAIARARPRPKATLFYARALTAHHDGDRDTAVAALQAAVAADGRHIMARGLLGDIFRNEDQYTKAAEQYQALTRLDPYWFQHHYHLGVCYQLLERLPEASASYSRALRLNPADSESSMNLGLVHLALGQTRLAVHFTGRAAELAPSSAAAWANHGAALDIAGQLPQAESAYRRAIELDSVPGPQQNGILLNLATNLTQQGKTREAIATFHILLKRTESALLRKRYGDALAASARHEEALRQYEASLRLDTRYYPAMNAMADALIVQYRQGMEIQEAKRRTALDLWKRSLQLNPQQSHVQELHRRWASPPGRIASP